MSSKTEQFEALMRYFPEVELPCVLTSDSLKDISKNNKPIPESLLAEYFSDWLSGTEYSEVLPTACFTKNKEFIGLVLWQLDLMEYTCHIMTMDRHGKLLDHQKIAELKVENESDISRQAAVIDSDLFVHTRQNLEGDNQSLKDLKSDGSQTFEVLPTGYICTL